MANYPVEKQGVPYENGAFTSMNAERFTESELKEMLNAYSHR
jgi:hypothetical protein